MRFNGEKSELIDRFRGFRISRFWCKGPNQCFQSKPPLRVQSFWLLFFFDETNLLLTETFNAEVGDKTMLILLGWVFGPSGLWCCNLTRQLSNEMFRHKLSSETLVSDYRPVNAEMSKTENRDFPKTDGFFRITDLAGLWRKVKIFFPTSTFVQGNGYPMILRWKNWAVWFWRKKEWQHHGYPMLFALLGKPWR